MAQAYGKCAMGPEEVDAQFCGTGLDFKDGKCIVNSDYWVPRQEVEVRSGELQEKFTSLAEEITKYMRNSQLSWKGDRTYCKDYGLLRQLNKGRHQCVPDPEQWVRKPDNE